MRRLSNLVLVLIGVLYPFIVYFGMDHVSTPIFGLILGALWLVRTRAEVWRRRANALAVKRAGKA